MQREYADEASGSGYVLGLNLVHPSQPWQAHVPLPSARWHAGMLACRHAGALRRAVPEQAMRGVTVPPKLNRGPQI